MPQLPKEKSGFQKQKERQERENKGRYVTQFFIKVGGCSPRVVEMNLLA
jgi:hypothetical protein